MIFRRMGADPSVSISSDSPNSNNSDTTLPWNPDLTSPNSNNSDTTLSRTSYLTPSEPDSNRSNITLPSISEPIPPDTNYSDVALPGFSTLLAPNNSVTPDRNYYKDLVPGNFRSSGPYKAGPTIENYSGVSDPRNLHPSIPDRHTLNSEPPLPLKRILSQPCLHCSRDFTLGIPCSRVEPCFECVKSNKFCSFPQSAVFVEPAIPPAPNHIFFRYHFPGGVVTANNFTLVKDLNWAEGDYMEARAFDTNTGIEMHGCMVGWYPKSV
ncbi:hypothetical protein BofuT4_P120500.1 [Botrytis cinerea T4]|uniref:Uncharacterized protein n=1 Tax=Botryotinia fuckeliana (strain T4) TaxID=999810 RepID=G2XY07_BOTF4|nr:hypothetical protein BofuT4_P120500.1 [Botrytis cinerea T4]